MHALHLGVEILETKSFRNANTPGFGDQGSHLGPDLREHHDNPPGNQNKVCLPER